MYMEKTMTDVDKEQLTEVAKSWSDAAVAQVSTDRHLAPAKVRAAFDASPQFAEDAKARGLVDRIGYDDDALGAGLARAGAGAKPFRITDYIKSQNFSVGYGANIAVIEAAGDIVDGTARGDIFNTSAGIASDDLSETIRQVAREPRIKAIVLRVEFAGRLGHRVGPNSGRGEEGASQGQAGGGEHGRVGRIGRLLHRG